ncbi:fimbrial protein [[Enterobacter] lignolyticus]|uniref:Fimbrial protein domain-containing protein n=1 Tax=Enterobacter lignolyticus (strain SCF1) TaxID=701347 RepID=E3G2H2_ENTLS|nr:fimbrial protein [[Enterobacter] lignolyticus]ADO46911.1 Fimbrial protein domain-containing protein [[Enterobacter] lignolyticus SCF1]
MKRFALAACVSLAMMAQPQAHQGTVYVTGTITDNTCAVSPDSKNLTVPMGDVSSKQFSRAGDGSRYEPFVINLEKCGGAASGVTVHFAGTSDSRNPALLALTGGAGYAAGVGVGIYNPDKSLIPLGAESGNTPISPNQATVALHFYARYIADGDSVAAGTANASATFVLTYA